MRRILVSILLASFALVLAPLAQAERGDNQPRDDGPPSGRDRPDGNGENGPSGTHRDDDRPPWLGRHEHDRAREGVMRGRMMPLEDLENGIGRATPGFRIGNPELLMFGGRPVYRMRWRTPDGHILIVFADAETGQVLDIRGR